MDAQLDQFLARHRRLFVLTGAGISTASGIPDYRDRDGAWKYRKPMEYRDFIATHAARQRSPGVLSTRSRNMPCNSSSAAL